MSREDCDDGEYEKPRRNDYDDSEGNLSFGLGIFLGIIKGALLGWFLAHEPTINKGTYIITAEPSVTITCVAANVGFRGVRFTTPGVAK